MPNKSLKKPVPLIIAHRGASSASPENTIAAFAEAIKIGADGIEFDVQLSKDGIPVVFHDPTLERIASRSECIDDMNAADLAEIDIGSWFAPAFSGEKIPALRTVLEFLSGYAGEIYIELKCGPEHMEATAKAVCGIIDKSPLAPHIIVKSFRPAVIPIVKQNAPNVRAYALFSRDILSLIRKKRHLAALAKEFGADGLSLHHSLVSPKVMEDARKFALPVSVWTVDKRKWIGRSVDLGISAVITNEPAVLLKECQRVDK